MVLWGTSPPSFMSAGFPNKVAVSRPSNISLALLACCTASKQSELGLGNGTTELILFHYFHKNSPLHSVFRSLWSNQTESESARCQSCPTLCDPMDCSPPGSSVHGILQARLLEWVAISFSRESSWPRDHTQISALQVDSLPREPPTEPAANPWTGLTLFCISICEKTLFSFNFHFFLLHLST